MTRRSRRTIPAVVLAVLLFGLCVAVAVSLIQRLTGAREFLPYDTVATRLHGLTWNEVPVLVAGVGAAVVGGLLLAVALWPGRPVVLALTDEDGIAAGVTRGGLRTALRRAADTVDGVDNARIRLRRNKVKVTAHTARVHSTELPEAICARLTERVGEIGPQRVRRVRATLRGPRSGRSTPAQSLSQKGPA